MSIQAWITLLVTLLTLYALVREKGPPDVIFVGAVVLLALMRIITPAQAFGGFANSGVLLVGALFVVAAALRETGVMDYVGHRVLGRANTELAALACIAALLIVKSAFLANTPIVAMMLPLVIDWCRKRQISPSRLLIPLSFLSILSGTCTLVGTSTNVVMHGLMLKANAEGVANLKGMSYLEIGYAGIPCAIIGTIYIMTVGRWLLPDRKELIEQLGESRREYLVEMLVQPDCRLIGQTIEMAGLRQLPGLFLIEIDRGGRIIGPVAPTETILAGDRMVFTGIVSTIVDLKKIPGLVPAVDATYEVSPRRRGGRLLCEAVISPTSPLVGKDIRHAEFRAQYNSAVVAVHRNGARLTNKIGDVVLRPGDTLLLQTGAHFIRAHRNNPDFYLISGVEDSRPLRHDRAKVAVIIVLGLIAAMASGFVDPTLVAFGAAGLMIATGCISAANARQSIDWSVLVMIAASFGLGTALQETGVAEVMAKGLVHATRPFGPLATLAAIYLGTMILNELITNNGAAVLAFPFCIEASKLLEVSPRPFIMAATLAASFAFASPIGYQTHMMVYGPGGYRFMDFVKVGLPLNVLLWIAAVILIPFLWSW
jgi:di/tricarboxylate transporter